MVSRSRLASSRILLSSLRSLTKESYLRPIVSSRENLTQGASREQIQTVGRLSSQPQATIPPGQPDRAECDFGRICPDQWLPPQVCHRHLARPPATPPGPDPAATGAVLPGRRSRRRAPDRGVV